MELTDITTASNDFITAHLYDASVEFDHLWSDLVTDHIKTAPLEAKATILAVNMLSRLKLIGLDSGELEYDAFLFKKGTTTSEISDWLTNNVNLCLDSILTLVGLPEFNSIDLENPTLPSLDLTNSLVVEIQDPIDEEIEMIGIKAGVLPLSPYFDDRFYTKSVLAKDTQGRMIEMIEMHGDVYIELV